MAGEPPIPLVVDSPSSTAKGTLLMPSKRGFREQLRVLGDLIALPHPNAMVAPIHPKKDVAIVV